MAALKMATAMSTSILSEVRLPRSAWIIHSSFVTSTRPSQEAKIDKETCEKVKKAAEAVTEGAKTVVRVGKFVEDTVASGAKNVVADVAKKAFEKATEENTEDKGVWEKAKDATRNIKEKIVGK